MIKFGTDGWRAVISEDFTFDNVRLVAQAISDYLKEVRKVKLAPRVIVGYDTRFLSDRYGQLVSEVLAGNGINVILTDGPCSVPAVCYTIKRLGLDGGVMVTASHNPPSFNGIKFKADYAGSGSPAITKRIEALIGKNPPKAVPIDQAKTSKMVQVEDPIQSYFDFVHSYIDMNLLKNSGLRILVDSMHGTGDEYIARILRHTSCQVRTIHAKPDPLFGGINPEPLPKNLNELISLMKGDGFDLGIATDGDGDRIGAVRSDGVFISPHWILALLLLHLVRYRKWTGAVCKTISTTTLLQKIAHKYNLPLHETPVGFKHISQLMRTEDVLIGGEESGGIGFKNYIPERDGFISGLLLAEIIACSKKSLIEQMGDVEKEFGRFHYLREDFAYPIKKAKRAVETLKKAPPQKILNKSIVECKTFDGIKFILKDESWLLIRPSGTEPKLRIYAEASTPEEVRQMIEFGKDSVVGI